MMINNRIVLLVAMTLMTVQAQAAIKDYLPDMNTLAPTTQPRTDGLKSVYAGAGFTNDFVHLNAELPTALGNVYAKVGGYLSGGNDAAVLAGWRFPYNFSGVGSNGYYVGVFGGHVDADELNNKEYNRLGGGLELSYVWMDRSRISAASLGIAMAEHKSAKNGARTNAAPLVLFSYSINFGIF